MLLTLSYSKGVFNDLYKFLIFLYTCRLFIDARLYMYLQYIFLRLAVNTCIPKSQYLHVSCQCQRQFHKPSHTNDD